ncbi:MAG: selenocysteine-specific translation elongation factor [Ardenticatenales bacterium]|nr:selenocysteine-specific translation elongation factor [Ardenticatenales bacterium]
MYVVGTAGHVDHGKSTLVEALTGIDPDRLVEEKEREMTIELGFAWLTLTDAAGNEEEVGVVDVPGHRDFIENMLAGVGGIDLALLVVAADEGVMPQTREHLAILDLLQVQSGVVALTKTDLIDDPDWLELVTLDVSEALAGTVLADAPIIPVSARTGAGLATLRQTLLARLQTTTPRADEGQPRLPIDRVFTLTGFGTVVTGTLVGGSLRLGDPVEIHPGEMKGRIRGLQTHRRKREAVHPGSRVAVNLTGVDRESLRRGQVLTRPGVLRDTILFDAAYRHLADAGIPLKHNMEIKLFAGAAEIVGRTRILGAPHIEPGAEGWLQIALREPAALVRGDRFILRLPSPGTTLGGGRVLDPHPGRRHRRFRDEVVARLQTLAQGTPAELLLQALSRLEPAPLADLLKQTGLDQETGQSAWEDLLADQRVVQIGAQSFTGGGWQRRGERLADLVTQYQRRFPLRAGISREEARSRLQLTTPLFQALVAQAVESEQIVDAGAILYTPDHAIRLDARQEAAATRLRQQMDAAGINTPSVKTCKAALGEDVYVALVDLGQLIPLNSDVVYARAGYERYRTRILDFLADQKRITAAQVRDLLQTSRKYAIAWLEHFDEQRLTRREGDDRVLL